MIAAKNKSDVGPVPDRAGIAAMKKSAGLLREPTLFKIAPEELALRVVVSAMAQLDRLAIYLSPPARMPLLRDLEGRDHKVAPSYALRAALGCAVVRLTRFAQTGALPEGSAVFEDITCVWEAAYSRSIDGSAIEGLRTLEADASRYTSELDIVMKAALARRRIAAGEAVSISALALLGDVPEDQVRSTIAPTPRSTVTPEIARVWLHMRRVPGF